MSPCMWTYNSDVDFFFFFTEYIIRKGCVNFFFKPKFSAVPDKQYIKGGGGGGLYGEFKKSLNKIKL